MGAHAIVLFRCDGPQHRYLEETLRRTGYLVGVVVEAGQDQRARLWREHRFRSWAWRAYQDIRQAVTGRARYSRTFFQISNRRAARGTADDCPRLHTKTINSPTVGRFVSELQPDLGVVCGTSIIAPGLLGLMPRMINVHGGHLPQYRGNHGVFFAFARSDFEHVAATLHHVTPALDGGPLIAVARPAMRPGMHDGHLYCAAVKLAIDELPALVSAPLPPPQVQSDEGGMYRHRDRTPIVEIRVWFRRRTGRIQVPFRSGQVVRVGGSSESLPDAGCDNSSDRY